MNDPPFVPNVGLFQAAFPVFISTNPIQIAATMLRASRNVSARVWGAPYTDGIWLLTAHWLTVDPMGSSTALKANAKSVYGDQFVEMRRSVVGGGMGVGGGSGIPSGGPGDGGPWWNP
jgi:hypothetical protein